MAIDRSRRLALVVAAVALVGSLTAVVIAGGADDDAPASDRVTVPLEFFDGTTGDLADFAGTPVIINFWASWCPACIAEMPDFGRVDRDMGDRVVFLGLNMQEISIDGAMSLIEETGVDYLMAHDRDGSIYRMFGGIAMPTTVFIRDDGTVARVHAGVIFENELRDIIDTELLG